MQHSRSIRVGGGVVAAAVALAVAAMSASAATGGHGVASAGQTTVTGTLITRPARTLAPGTAVRSNELVGQRVFVDAAHGFALAGVGQAQYPAATSNGPAAAKKYPIERSVDRLLFSAARSELYAAYYDNLDANAPTDSLPFLSSGASPS